MKKYEPKVIIHDHVSVDEAFAVEEQLIQTAKSGASQASLLFWQPRGRTLVLPASKRWKNSPELKQALAKKEWRLVSRRTGGAPVPQTKGILNMSHLYIADKHYSIVQGYQDICAALTVFFNAIGVQVSVHATPNSYCDGDYNININGRKVVGTAQRVMRSASGEKLVLAQACILVNVALDEIVFPVNVCNEMNQKNETVLAQAHTCLQEHLTDAVSMGELYKQLKSAFKQVGISCA